MSVTYTVTEDNGTIHTRTSKEHIAAKYLFAVVRVPGDTYKANVTYQSRKDLADKELRSVLDYRANEWNVKRDPSLKIGDQVHPHAKIYPVDAKVKGR